MDANGELPWMARQLWRRCRHCGSVLTYWRQATRWRMLAVLASSQLQAPLGLAAGKVAQILSATELVNAGVSLATIRKRLGHKNLQTTPRYAEQSDATADAELRVWRRQRRT